MSSDPIYMFTGASPYGGHTHGDLVKCVREYGYKRELGLIFPGNAYMARGTLVHVGLAHSYARRACVQPGGWKLDGERHTDPRAFLHPDKAILRAAEEANYVSSGLLTEDDVLMCRATIPQYHAKYDPMEKGWKIRGVEHLLVKELDVPGVGMRPYTQRADLIIYDAYDRAWIADHKTKYRPSKSASQTKFTMSRQFLTLRMFGEEIFGDKFGGVMVNQICFAPGKDAKPGTFSFDRGHVEPAPHAQYRVWEDIIEHKLRLHAILQSGREVWDWPQADHEEICMHNGERCAAHNLCRFGKGSPDLQKFARVPLDKRLPHIV